MPSLTIATATYDDLVGLQNTIQHLALLEDPVLAQAELVVVDNHPTYKPDGQPSDLTKRVQSFVTGAGGRYIAMPEPHGTAAPRNRCVQEATGDVVLVMDSHVLLGRHTAAAVLEYFADPTRARDIVSGPQLSKRRDNPDGHLHRLSVLATHYADVWRAEMWGIWAQAWSCVCGRWNFDVAAAPQPAAESGMNINEAGQIVVTAQTPATPHCLYYPLTLGRVPVDRCPECGQPLPDLPYPKHAAALEAAGYLRRGWSAADTEPFEIPGNGLGMFAVCREHWQGFPPGMVGFGGGELHLHEQTRRAGGRAVCVPQATWWHCYERCSADGRPPYHLDVWQKVRNYVIWRQHLRMDLQPVYDHFVRDIAKLSDAQWDYLIRDAIGRLAYPGHLATAAAPPVAAATVSNLKSQISNPKSPRPQPPADADTAEKIYAWTLTTKRDCIEHLPTIRKLASQADVVVGLTKRREWDVAVLAGQANSPASGGALAPRSFVSHNTEQDPLLDMLAAHTSPASHYSHDSLDSLAAPPIDCDLLLIDTVHSADRLTAELDRWLPHCRRWIAIRGTRAFGETAEGHKTQPGLLVAVRQIVAKHPDWKRVYQEELQYGLTILSCDPAERTIDRGVGYELAALYKSLGINPPQNCTCRALAARMDSLGPAGCRAQEDELIKAMEENAAKYKWTDTLKAGFKSIGQGLAFKINPLDPLRSCLRIAIERAEAEETAWVSAATPTAASAPKSARPSSAAPVPPGRRLT